MSLSAIKFIDSVKSGQNRYQLFMAFANDLQIQVYRIFMEAPDKISSKEPTCILNVDQAHSYGVISSLEFYYQMD